MQVAERERKKKKANLSVELLRTESDVIRILNAHFVGRLVL